jgi:hypothetical protein
MFKSKCPSNLPVDDDKTKVLEDLKSYPGEGLSEVLADSCYGKLLGKTYYSHPKFCSSSTSPTDIKNRVLRKSITLIINKYIQDKYIHDENNYETILKIINHIIIKYKTNEDKTPEDRTDEDRTDEDRTDEDKTYENNLETRLETLKNVITSQCLNNYDVIKNEVLTNKRKEINLKIEKLNYDESKTTNTEDNLTQATNTENNLTQASRAEDNLTPEQVRNNIIFIDKEIADGINTESKHKTDNFTIKDLKSHKLEYLLIKEIENYNEDKDKILKIEIILNINTTYYKFIYYNIFKSLYLNKIYKLNNYQNQTLQIYPPENEDSLFTSKVDPFLYIYNNLICTEENKLNKIIEDCSKNVTISCIYIKYYITKKITKENGGFKLKTKNKINKVSKKSIKENKYKEVLGKRMKIYKKPDSRKEFVRYKGGLVPLVEYKKTMKEIVRAKNKKH